MTIAATLTVRARPDGFRARLRYTVAAPVLVLDGVEHDLSLLGEPRRLAIAPGTHHARVEVRGRGGRVLAAAEDTVTLAPGAEARLEVRVADGAVRVAPTP